MNAARPIPAAPGFARRADWYSEYDRHIAAGADVLGTILMLVAPFWGGYILYRQYRNLPGKA